MLRTLAALAIAAAVSLPAVAAEPGAQAYAEHCSACHGATLAGATPPNVGPPLKGRAFTAKWHKASAASFLDTVTRTMPLNQPASLDTKTYAAIAGFIRAANRLPIDTVASAGPTVKPNDGGTQSSDSEINDDDIAKASRQRLTTLASRVAPVTDETLRAPSDDDWLAWRRDQATLGYSRLDQINRANVGQLTLAWSLSLGSGTNAIAPLVHDGVMYIHSNGVMQALDARNGDVIWEHARAATTTRVPSTQPRSVALYGDAVYVPTVDNHVLALDAKSGRLLWDHEIAKPADRLELTAAPLVAHGKIIQGVSGCQGSEYGGGCFIVALDAATGQEVWRFNTIARPGQTGGDSWNGADLARRFGGSVWTTGSYDPDLNLVYFGTGQTYVISTLLNPSPRPGQTSDALFTDTTLALNPDTGTLAWYYQHAAGDVWDLDWAFEQTLVTLQTPAGPRKAVVTSGKTAIIDAVDAMTGQYLWSYDIGLQNLVIAIDPITGRKSNDPGLTPEIGKPKLVCPSSIGDRNWPATAYDPSRGLMYVTLAENCMTLSRANADTGKQSFHSFGEFDQERRVPPDNDGHFGRVVALDLNSRSVAWTNRYRAPLSSAELATAGGLLFDGRSDRWFRALDSASGKALWETRLDNPPNGFPITFKADGRQYVAVVTGGGTPLDLFLGVFTPEVRRPTSNKTLMVFALPQGGVPSP